MADSSTSEYVDAELEEADENEIAAASLHTDGFLPSSTTGILVVSQTGEVIATGDATALQGGQQAVPMFTLDNKLVIANIKVPTTTYSETMEHEVGLPSDSAKSILSTVQEMILNRLESIEQKVESFGIRCQQLEEKLQNVFSQLKEGGFTNRLAFSSGRGRSGTIIVGVPPSNFADSAASAGGVQLITLNSEDYPNGAWLGDPTNPDLRVRVPVSPEDLESLNKTCTTPEKMALTLLDYLFDRETQACSNLSGTSKHGKKQLDPLKVYGIRCHLMYKFEINEKDWHRIRQNLDSKCRTAFRRKQRGMPLMVKAFKERMPHSSQQQTEDESLSFPDAVHLQGLTLDQDIDLASGTTVSLPLSHFGGKTQVIHTDRGDIQVVHATAEQLAEIQQTHQIQIYAGSEDS